MVSGGQLTLGGLGRKSANLMPTSVETNSGNFRNWSNRNQKEQGIPGQQSCGHCVSRFQLKIQQFPILSGDFLAPGCNIWISLKLPSRETHSFKGVNQVVHDVKKIRHEWLFMGLIPLSSGPYYTVKTTTTLFGWLFVTIGSACPQAAKIWACIAEYTLPMYFSCTVYPTGDDYTNGPCAQCTEVCYVIEVALQQRNYNVKPENFCAVDNWHVGYAFMVIIPPLSENVFPYRANISQGHAKLTRERASTPK